MRDKIVLFLQHYQTHTHTHTHDHVLFKCIKLEKERELFKKNMMVKHRKWTFVKFKLVKDYTQEFVAYLNSILKYSLDTKLH